MTQSKADKIEETRQKLPLPEQPDAPSDFNSADSRITGEGNGRFSSDVSYGDGTTAGLREPATKSSEETDMSGIGREGVEKAKASEKSS